MRWLLLGLALSACDDGTVNELGETLDAGMDPGDALPTDDLNKRLFDASEPTGDLNKRLFDSCRVVDGGGDGEPLDGALDAEPLDAEPRDAEPLDAEPLDAEPTDDLNNRLIDSGVGPECRPLVLGHRGFAWNRLGNPLPENTVVSVEAALEAGADGVEVDVVKTADDVLVLRHDDNLATRSPDGRPRTDCRGRITQLTWAELEDCNAQPFGEGRSEPLDRIEDLLALPMELLVLDVKNDGIDVENEDTLAVVLDALADADALERTVLMLYRADTIRAAEAAGARACLKRQNRADEDGEAIAGYVHDLDAWGSCASGHLVDEALMTSLRDAGREQVTFFLGNEPTAGYDRRIRAFGDLDVLAVISDQVEHAVAVRAEWKQGP